MKTIIEKRKNGSTRVATVNDKPSMTQQHHKPHCDVNNILNKYRTTGMLTHINQKQPIYGDFSNLPSYQEALDTVLKAHSTFMDLPSEVRRKFGNNPELLMNFLKDENNNEEAIKLGLRLAPEKESIIKVQVDNIDALKQQEQIKK